MYSILLVAGAVTAALVGLLALVFRKLAHNRHTTVADPQWLAGFSPLRYRPMERLLAQTDLDFLAAQPGYSKALGRKLRAERRRLFALYLHNMVRDFGRLQCLGRVLILSAPEDRPDFAAALMRAEVQFRRTLLIVRWRLFVHSLAGSPVDVRDLVGALNGMNLQVRSLAALPLSA